LETGDRENRRRKKGEGRIKTGDGETEDGNRRQGNVFS